MHVSLSILVQISVNIFPIISFVPVKNFEYALSSFAFCFRDVTNLFFITRLEQSLKDKIFLLLQFPHSWFICKQGIFHIFVSNITWWLSAISITSHIKFERTLNYHIYQWFCSSLIKSMKRIVKFLCFYNIS